MADIKQALVEQLVKELVEKKYFVEAVETVDGNIPRGSMTDLRTTARREMISSITVKAMTADHIEAARIILLKYREDLTDDALFILAHDPELSPIVNAPQKVLDRLRTASLPS